MQRWEYRRITASSAKKLEAELQKLGEQGWELVAVISTTSPFLAGLTKGAPTTYFHAFLKRPVT